MARLPQPGADQGVWGDVLNEFLGVEHNSDGTLKASGSLTSKANDNAVVHNSGNETINGVKTFAAAPVVPTAAFPQSAVSGLSTALTAKQDTSAKGAANGYASLDGSSQVPVAQLPVGTASGTIAAGNDSRITGAEQTTNKGAANGYASLDGTTHVPIAQLPTGTSSTTVAIGNDSRITGAIQAAIVDAKGDIIAATAADTVARLAVGTDGQVLTADATQTTGLRWATPSAGGIAGSFNVAKRYGYVAMNWHIVDISSNTPVSVAAVANRLYLVKMWIDGDSAITSAHLAIGASGSGAGSVYLGVYEISGSNLTLAGSTPDSAAVFTGGSFSYRGANLSAPVASQSTGRWVFHAVLSTLATGPTFYITHSGLNTSLYNPNNTLVTGYLGGQSTLPASITIASVTLNDSEHFGALG